MGEQAADSLLLQAFSSFSGEAASSIWAELVGAGGSGMNGVVLGVDAMLAGSTLLFGCCWLLLLPCLLSASAGTGITKEMVAGGQDVDFC